MIVCKLFSVARAFKYLEAGSREPDTTREEHISENLSYSNALCTKNMICIYFFVDQDMQARTHIVFAFDRHSNARAREKHVQITMVRRRVSRLHILI